MRGEAMALRVLSYNIRMGGEDRLPAIANVIRRAAPDAVALLEANSRDNAEALAGELDMAMAFGEANSVFHIAWLSRLPIQRAENHRHAALQKTLLEIEVRWEDAPLRLFATHLSAGRAVDDAELEARRAVEARTILDVLRPLAGQPHLLVGDFNALHPSDDIRTDKLSHPGAERARRVAGVPRQTIPQFLAAGYVDCYRALHSDTPGYTYRAHTPFVRLDYALASPELASRLRACDVVSDEETARASDHLPILVEFG